MEMIIGILILCGIGYLGFWHAAVLIENKKLKENFIQSPTQQIFIGAHNQSHIWQLVQKSYNAHKRAEDEARIVKTDAELLKEIRYTSGDVLLYYTYGEPITKLTQREINDYSFMLFFDEKLPRGAEREVIQALGLNDYMIKIGICTKGKGV